MNKLAFALTCATILLTHSLAHAQTASSFDKGSGGSAQAYPTRPVRVIIPFAAGGPADFQMRLIGPKLNEAWGHPVILDNRGGANQMLGSELAAKSPPDGYTLLVITGGAAINVSLYPKLPYDTLKDFAPISLVAPAKTPPAIIKKVHDDIARILATSDVREKMINQGMEATSNTPEAFSAHIRSEIVKWAKVVKASGAKPE